MNKIITLENLEAFAEINDTLKADKDVEATTGNLAKFDENGNPIDSGINANATYLKPSTGIPADDLSADVINSLNKANSAVQDTTSIELRIGNLETYFSNESDAGNTIDKWNELVAFLSGINETTTLNDIITENLGGVKIKKITLSAYDTLVSNNQVDSNTLYIINE